MSEQKDSPTPSSAEAAAAPAVAPIARAHVPPTLGEQITSEMTGNTYTMGGPIGEGFFGVVYECRDVWENDLAVKVLKPIVPYEHQKVAATSEFGKLVALRNPFITSVFDAFEYRDTFYIITERCHFSLQQLLAVPNFQADTWLMPIARSVLQAVHYLHINGYVHQDIHPGNVFAALVRDEVTPTQPQATKFKLGDLGIAQMVSDVSVSGVRAQWMVPPEIIDSVEFGPIDRRLDIYHVGLLLLQILHAKQLPFTREEIVAGKPREMALALQSTYSVALEKALRRHVAFRTASAMEFWRDLHTPANPKPDVPASGG